jgi:hypothetical protein
VISRYVKLGGAGDPGNTIHYWRWHPGLKVIADHRRRYKSTAKLVDNAVRIYGPSSLSGDGAVGTSTCSTEANKRSYELPGITGAAAVHALQNMQEYLGYCRYSSYTRLLNVIACMMFGVAGITEAAAVNALHNMQEYLGYCRYSSYTKILHVIACMMRVLTELLQRCSSRNVGACCLKLQKAHEEFAMLHIDRYVTKLVTFIGRMVKIMLAKYCISDSFRSECCVVQAVSVASHQCELHMLKMMLAKYCISDSFRSKCCVIQAVSVVSHQWELHMLVGAGCESGFSSVCTSYVICRKYCMLDGSRSKCCVAGSVVSHQCELHMLFGAGCESGFSSVCTSYVICRKYCMLDSSRSKCCMAGRVVSHRCALHMLFGAGCESGFSSVCTSYVICSKYCRCDDTGAETFIGVPAV